MQYSPDRWVVLNIQDKACKVLGGWTGGYLDAHEWRLSSGIVEVVDDGDHWIFKNRSGSEYHCDKDRYGFTGLSGDIFNRIQTRVTLVEEKDVRNIKTV